MAAQRHHHLFERGVAGPFADAVDRDLGLPGAVQDAAQRIGRSHAQIVVAVGRNDRPVDVGNVVHEVFDLRAVFVRKTVARRVGDVDHRGAGRNGRFDHAGEVFGFGPAGVFGVELHVFDVAFGVFYRVDSRFEYLFGRRTQFVVDVLGRDADTGILRHEGGREHGDAAHHASLACGEVRRAGFVRGDCGLAGDVAVGRVFGERRLDGGADDVLRKHDRVFLDMDCCRSCGINRNASGQGTETVVRSPLRFAGAPVKRRGGCGIYRRADSSIPPPTDK